ncbi:4-hydroxy-tetrahydrodipicolinate reductase [Trichlorobacter lovleyi]|uniref:4-hydroxy-tetrahydrodipicolinate reductase n=1 Tax=Trichlorobacter lovleyi (strain ATCC BAA-1151 / DSM 17278 / SZ) TaxID=398767 RepID=DAPB_TRIL1|nr:4-hydroxy-tetrahydrodipicolinate reductase [Trichlorobacter lovleyi]B3E935.1 RecName: Full=4-hydroxy-tetrahydrodipicolinate reductase; Short=HTPA reductase [Trichlorobacter lovleyi SZ]ACD96748.1 Dihydrodipicolinate reductase [Trichlorobacter lovleyi SZ]
MIKIAVCGAAGRMGQRIIVAAVEAGCIISGALERPGHPQIGQDAGLIAGCGQLGVAISDDLNAVVEGCDVLIDFTTPKISLKNLEVCGLKKKSIVIGSTGFTPEERALAAELAKDIPAVLAPNMSVGVNVCFKMLKDLAKTLGDDFDVEIVELHHNKKKDSPSGTAVRMGEVVAEALGRDYNQVANYHREGICGERTKEEIGMQTVRGGDIVGEHTVYFIGMGERIEISHRAMSRDMFSRGSVRAAKWIVGKQPGLYDMQDVLGLK